MVEVGTTPGVTPGFLVKLGAFTLGLAAAILCFVWIVDPYGIAPFHLAVTPWNAAKPMRQNIDRLIKPFEVWRYQPQTVFLGTSRMHQSLDPHVMEGSRFAPAYNAAIPASTIGENLANIRLYARLDRHLKTVILETFFYNFLRDEGPVSDTPMQSVVQNYVQLTFSGSALIDSMRTIVANRTGAYGQHVEPGGFFVHDPWFDSGNTFNAKTYDTAIAATLRNQTRAPTLRPSSLKALAGIVQFCKEHDLELILVQAPNYAWDDYRLYRTGLWPALTEQFHVLASYDNVVSFAQRNDVSSEPPGTGMKWWYDPVHFNRATGTLMLQSILAGQSTGPANFMAPVTPQTVDKLLTDREEAVRQWAASNVDFVRAFDAAVVPDR